MCDGWWSLGVTRFLFGPTPRGGVGNQGPSPRWAELLKQTDTVNNLKSIK